LACSSLSLHATFSLVGSALAAHKYAFWSSSEARLDLEIPQSSINDMVGKSSEPQPTPMSAAHPTVIMTPKQM
jgi:hypothetical protein